MKLFMPPLINNKEIIEQRERQRISNLSKDRKERMKQSRTGMRFRLSISRRIKERFHSTDLLLYVAALRTAQTVKPWKSRPLNAIIESRGQGNDLTSAPISLSLPLSLEADLSGVDIIP